jgi:regulator of PEP synthase PpsR (kinase-PPPase family)
VSTPKPEGTEVVVVSDGTGETAAALVRAAMAQFAQPWRLRVFGGVRHRSQLRRPVDQAARTGAMIFFTLVDPEVAESLKETAARNELACTDLLEPVMGPIAMRLSAEPRREPGILHGFSDEYFRRIEAVEFAVRHDDGANLRTLFQADLVLTGPSRTSKTPLSMYLAQRGLRTGNVPLVPGMEPPSELLEMDPRKVIGLLAQSETLETVRRARVHRLGRVPYSSYVEAEAVEQELARARRLYRERGWRAVDITGRAVEENAARILEGLE